MNITTESYDKCPQLSSWGHLSFPCLVSTLMGRVHPRFSTNNMLPTISVIYSDVKP